MATESATVVASWLLPEGADQARLCYLTGTAAPGTPAAPATCLPLTSDSHASFLSVKGRTVSVSVFAYSAASGRYGTPVSDTVVVKDEPPRAPVELFTFGIGSSSLRLTWKSYEEVVAYDVTVVAGAAPPSPGTPVTARVAAVDISSPGELVSSGAYTATGLDPGRAYTFSVRARDHSSVSRPVWRTAATRSNGAYLMRSGDGFKDTRLPTHLGEVVDADVHVSRSGHVRALVTFKWHTLAYLSRTASTGWSEPVVLAQPHQIYDAQLAVSATGALVVSWSDGSGVLVRTRPAGSSTWGAAEHLTSTPHDPPYTAEQDNDELQTIVADNAGNVHALVRRDCNDNCPTTNATQGLLYLSNATGAWRQQHIDGTDRDVSGELAHDRETDRVSLLVRNRVWIPHFFGPAVSLRVATKDASTEVFGPTSVRATARKSDYVFVESHLAASHGRVSIVVQRGSTRAATAGGSGIFVLTGTSAASIGHWQRLEGTTRHDEQPRVSAYSHRGLSVAWLRVSPTWNRASQGVWSAAASYNASASVWSSAAKHATTSAYDIPVAAYRDVTGQSYAASVRLYADYRLVKY